MVKPVLSYDVRCWNAFQKRPIIPITAPTTRANSCRDISILTAGDVSPRQKPNTISTNPKHIIKLAAFFMASPC